MSADPVLPAAESPDPPPGRCGFVAVVGGPNVGKSTLVNRLVGTKVTIVSPKVQTTRTRVLGIVIHKGSQVILVDTPGIFAPRRRLDRAMVAAAWGGAAEADRVLLLIDAARGLDGDAARILGRLESEKQSGRPLDLVLNKIDKIKKPRLLELAASLGGRGVFERVFMVSALDGDGVGDLLDHLAACVPAGPWHYPEDQVSDMPMRLLAAEITREKLYLQLRQELPYAATVETEGWEEHRDGSIKVSQVIYVRTAGQKGIVLGRGGERVKALGLAARLDLEEILETRVHLFLFVKVREDWGDDPERYRDWGLDFGA